MNYRTLKAKNDYEMETAINKAFKEGWRLQGGVSVSEGILYQAMVRHPSAPQSEYTYIFNPTKEQMQRSM